jgi:hypothetical protein
MFEVEVKTDNDSLLGTWLLHQISEWLYQPAIHVLNVWPCAAWIMWQWKQSWETSRKNMSVPRLLSRLCKYWTMSKYSKWKAKQINANACIPGLQGWTHDSETSHAETIKLSFWLNGCMALTSHALEPTVFHRHLRLQALDQTLTSRAITLRASCKANSMRRQIIKCQVTKLFWFWVQAASGHLLVQQSLTFFSLARLIWSRWPIDIWRPKQMSLSLTGYNHLTGSNSDDEKQSVAQSLGFVWDR